MLEPVGCQLGIADRVLNVAVPKVGLKRPGQGRSGGFRVLIAYRAKARSVFLFGFAKSARANVSATELESAREIAQGFLAADSRTLVQALAAGMIEEVDYGEEEKEN